MGRLVVIVVITFLITASFIWLFFIRETSPQKAAKEGPVIFLGDSLTAGVGAEKDKDFPTVIADQLDLTNVINAGVSGDTTAAALKRLQTDVLDQNPSLVIITLGGNDFLGSIPVGTTTKNIDEIVKRISESGSAVVLVHIKAGRLRDNYREPFSEIAKKYKAAFVPDVLGSIIINNDLMSDQIHPNAKGYVVMADKILPSVKKLLN